MSLDKIIARVENLLRRAAPNSGSSQNEREIAALEASRLFAENNLVVREREPEPRRVSRQRPQQPRYSPSPPGYPPGAPNGQRQSAPSFGGNWVPSVAMRDSRCSDPDCRGVIVKSDPVWMRQDVFKVYYIHRDGPCGW